jgi:periplasmic divalent cation tolerance protein
MTEILMVWSTFPDEETAAKIVRILVDERLIACAQLTPNVRSIYRWKDAIEDQREVVGVMKTRKQDWAALLSRIHELHPYEVPEVVCVRMAAGAPKYLEWLDEVLSPAEPSEGGPGNP